MTVTWNNATKTGSWSDPTAWSLGHVPTVDEGIKISNNYKIGAGSGTFYFRYIDIDGGELEIGYNTAMKGKDLPVDVADHSPAWHIRVRNTANTKLTGYQTYNGWSVLGSAVDNPANRLNFMVEPPSVTAPIITWMEPGQHWFWLTPAHVSTFLGTSNQWVWFNQKTTGAGFPKDIHLNSVSFPDRTPILTTHTIEGRTGDKVHRNGMHSGTVQLDGTFTIVGRPDMDLAALRDTNEKLCFISPYVTLNRCYVDSLKMKPSPGTAWIQYSMTLIEDL